MDIAVSAVLGCCATPLTWAWNGAKKQCFYCIKYKQSALAFDCEAKEFLEKAQHLQDMVETSVRRSIREELQSQLDKARDIKIKVNLLTIDLAKARSSACFLYSHYKLSKRVAKLRKAMMQLLQDPKFNSAVSLQPQAIRPRSRVERPDDFLSFTSRKLSMDSIMNALKDEGRSIVRVYGMGGVGKTYMVKAVASRALKERIFDQVVVSVVSQNLDLRKIQGDIAHGLGVELISSEVRDRADDLRNILNDHSNILLILDDLWEKIDLSDIGIPQYSESCKCKILITTRQMHVCDDLDRHPAIPINVLSGDDPWKLFSQKAGDILKQKSFIEIGKEIVEECRGLPIALSTVGSALRNKDLSYWQSAATRPQRSKNTSIQEDGLNSVVGRCIELSYSFLPNDMCKRFFLMCSFFPEDYNVPKETLTRYGMGLALIPNIECVKEARGDTHQTVEELKAACLLLDGDKEETVKMHDVIRDISIQIGINQQPKSIVVKAGMALENWPRDTLTSSCGAISLMSNHLKQLPHGVDCPGTETLLLQDNKNLRLVPDEFFQGMRALKVLDFTSVRIKSLPSSTQHLSLLRLLSLDNCRFLKDVSMIGVLNKLETLTLRMSGIASLPESFANLKELRILDITLSLKCENVPPGVISSMNKLEELYMQGCFADWEITNEKKKANFQELLTLGSLTILKVDIIDVRYLLPDHNSSVSPNWEKFDICVSASEQRRLANATQGASFSRGLATGVKLEAFPNWFRQAVAHKAEKLSYQLCGNLSNILEEYHHGKFDGVKYLYVDQCADIAQLIKLGNRFPNQPVFPLLEKLNIHHMQKTEGICVEDLPSGSLQKVKILEVGECPNLRNALLPPNLIQRMPNLEEVHAKGTSIEAVFGFEGLIVQSGQLKKLKRLILENLSQLTSLWRGPSEIVMFHRLEVVKVSRCEKLKYILPYSVCDFLCHLQVLWLEDCSILEQVIGDNRDENGVHEVPEDMILPRLRDLVLVNLPRLTDFYTHEASLRCPELQRLHIKGCERLRTNLSDYHSDQEIQLIPEKQLKRLETFWNSAQ